MSAEKKSTQSTERNEKDDDKIVSTVSLPAFQVVSGQDDTASCSLYSDLRIPRRSKKSKPRGSMEETTTVAQIHSTPVKVHQSSRKSKSQSRHDRHRCHKSRYKSTESLPTQSTDQSLLDKINKLKYENYLLNKKLNVSMTSLDSGLSQNEMLPPFEMDINNAYQHLKNENNKLVQDLKSLKTEYKEMTVYIEKLYDENKNLNEDLLLMKNLVCKLNVELERYQMEPDSRPSTARMSEMLPSNYDNNFLRPVLPLLKAYSETIIEKNELIEEFEADFKKFTTNFNELLKENERLYKELETKACKGEGNVLDELKSLKRDFELVKQENVLLTRQVELGKEKLLEIHSVYRMKVADVWKQKENVNESLQDSKAELYTLKGKYSVLKQEFERLKLDNDNRVPLVVHSASIGECKRLFQDLKNEYEMDKQKLVAQIKDQEKTKKQNEDWMNERNHLERTNFDLTFENETLRRRIGEFEARLAGGEKNFDPEMDKNEMGETKKLLRESNRKVEELSSKLVVSKKQLHKAMSFAEDIVREQERLLMQLHNKQKENNYMATQFGSLKTQLKDVEKGAHEGLNSIEEKIKSLESENMRLSSENKRLKNLLKEKEELISHLEPTRDSTS